MSADGKLTTHVLDTSNGVPGAGIAVTLYRVNDGQRAQLQVTQTNSDGRCDAPLLAGDSFEAGIYELEFDVGSYFRERAGSDSSKDAGNDPQLDFLSTVILRFGINNRDQHYHVPLLVSPFSYTTYRGS